MQLQIFPDGRCGVALEGRPLGLSRDIVPTSERYWVVVEGNSLENRMLVGPLEVWEGVRGDIDWSRLGRGSDRHNRLPSSPDSAAAARVAEAVH